MPEHYLWAALICLVAGGLFSLAEGALKGLSGGRLEALERARRAAGAGEKTTFFFHYKSEMAFSARIVALAALLGWIAFALTEYLHAQSGGEPSFLSILEVFAASFAIAAIMGRMVPLRLGRRLSTRFPSPFFSLMGLVWVALWPVVRLVRWASRVADKTLGPDEAEYEERRAAEDVMTAVEEGERRELIEEGQKEMIKSILEMGESDVSEIMTPRVNMVSISADAPIDEAVKFCAEQRFSRIPAYQETRDNIVGFLYVKDLLDCLSAAKSGAAPGTIRPILRAPFMVPETKKVRDLLQEFQEKKIHLAVVVDEYGGTAGIVTLEDILEEIVGEIRDEYDTGEEAAVVRVAENAVEAKAGAHIDEINETIDARLPESADYDTVGGLIFGRLGRVPAQNETIKVNNAEITILKSDKRRIYRVRVEVRAEEE